MQLRVQKSFLKQASSEATFHTRVYRIKTASNKRRWQNSR